MSGQAVLVHRVSAEDGLPVVAADDLVATIIEAIQRAAKTGKIGDGKIFVTDVLDAVRIRTGEHGEEAI